jgi:POT family proton-dependent oligopeptide transporter
VILWTTSLPIAIENGAALGGYVAAIIVIGFGTGGIKSNMYVPFERHKQAHLI